MLSRLSISQQEQDQRSCREETTQKAEGLFLEHGAIWIENVFPKSLIQKLFKVYMKKYAGMTKQELAQRDACVGDQRFMITINIKGAFNKRELYANPILMPLLERLLSPHLRIASFGSVVAFPGADNQAVHLDHPPLFGSSKICDQLPPHAITMVVPLVDIDAKVGTTAIWEGTHRSEDRIEKLSTLMNTEVDSLDYSNASLPLPQQGDVYMMDYRVIHGGLANQSKIARPILYIVYSRPWFKDAFNFSKQPSVQISPKQNKKVPKKLRGLFF